MRYRRFMMVLAILLCGAGAGWAQGTIIPFALPNCTVTGEIAVYSTVSGWGCSATIAPSSPIFGVKITVGLAADDDPLIVDPITKGANSFSGTFTSVDLTAARTWTFPDSSGTVARTQDKLSAFAATTSAEFAGVVSDETGTGLLVFDTAPSFASTIRIGAAATYDGIIVSPAVKGANQFDLTLSTLDLTAARAINFPNAAGTIALTADKLSAFAATTSAELAGVLSDETGSGASVFGTAPTFTNSIEVSGASALLTFTDTTAGEDDFSFDADVDVFSFKSGATTLWQGFGATHATQAGNVYFPGSSGFGTATPTARVDVAGTIRSTGQTVPTTGAGVEIQYAAGVGYIYAYDRDAPGYKPLVVNDGNFGVGTVDPRYKNTTVGVLSSLLSDDGTNYEGLTITPASGSVTFAAVTAGTGADNIDLVLTPAGTGRLKYGIALNTAVDGGLTGAFLANAVGSTGGPTAAAQNGWLIAKDSAGATIWVPVWK